MSSTVIRLQKFHNIVYMKSDSSGKYLRCEPLQIPRPANIKIFLMQAAADKLEGEALSSCLRQLVVNCEPLLREASGQEQVDEILQHLEENDENFHKYELVKALRQRLNQVIEPLIDEEEQMLSVSRPRVDESGDIIDSITERIFNSDEFKLLCDRLKSQVASRVDIMLKNFDEEFSNRQSLQPEPSAGYAAKQSFSWSDVDSTFSSLNQTSLTFMSNEQFGKICQSLDKQRDVPARREAMSKLCQTSAINQSYDSWLILERPLLDALCDPDETLSGLALRFLSKGFAVTSPNVGYMYTLLCRYLRLQFTGDEHPATPLPRLSDVLVVNDAARLLRAFRLLNEFQQRIPQFWVRYSEKFLDKVLDSTVSLLSVRQQQQQQQQQLTPMHFLALLDPRAVWLTKWLHGSYSREPLLGLLSQRKYLCVFADSVRHCLRFLLAATAAPSSAAGAMQDRQAREAESAQLERQMLRQMNLAGGGGRLVYTGAQLDYLQFVHCLLLVTRLMHYARGRAMFPVTDGDAQVTCSKFAVAMVRFLQTYRRQPVGKKGLLEPSALVKDALVRLASNSQSCAASLCNDEVAAALLQPLVDRMMACDRRQRRPAAASDDAADGAIQSVADVISAMAATAPGLKFLLQNSSALDERAPAHLVAQLTKRALKKAVGLSRSACLTLLHVCRQLYSTPDGLHSLRPFRLHELAAQAWREAKADVAAAAADGGGPPNLTYWEENLRDSLLSLASTPRGVLLLHQTGAMADCAARMCARYVRKQQVGKCQRFGYGHMLAQLVGTARGFRHATDAGGFVPALLQTVWAAIECGTDDRLAAAPRPWPIEAVDPPALKPLTGLCRLLSAFPAVCECFADRPLPSRATYSLREVPADLPALFDRLVLLDRPAKLSSLFHPEQSAVFGLRLLSCIAGCLDSLLLLQSQYDFCSALLAAQFLDCPGSTADATAVVGGEGGADRDDDENSSRRLVIDAVTIERNYVLVKAGMLGGPSERRLPARELDEDSEYHYEICRRLPPPASYFVRGREGLRGGKPDAVLRFAESSPETGLAWLGQGRGLLLQELGAGGHMSVQGLAKLIEKAAHLQCQSQKQQKKGFLPPESGLGTDDAAAAPGNAKMEELGIQLMIEYGMNLRLLSAEDNPAGRLRQLLRSVRGLLAKEQRRPRNELGLKSLDGVYRGFDWFAASIFLLFGGSQERALACLQNLAVVQASAYLWPHRMHNSLHLPEAIRDTGASPVLYKTCHLVEQLLAREQPQVAAAFRLSGICPATVLHAWLRQGFLCALDWSAVVQYTALLLLCGPDYQVYFCLSLLRHLAPGILERHQRGDLLLHLREAPLAGFGPAACSAQLQELEARYRSFLLPEMMDLSQL